METCYGGTDVMERSCAMARGKDINKCQLTVKDSHTGIEPLVPTALFWCGCL
jgi:hypothetical protein